MIDILVPVLGRPQNALPLVESARTTTSDYQVVFICSPRDTAQIEACYVTGQKVMIVDWTPEIGDYAKKINFGFRHTEGEWVFQGADDIRFMSGWDREALLCAKRTGKRVIGTNDLHNPNVMRQKGSTHSLIARSYIEQLGGTEDGTGEILHEGYDHQYVDSELIEVARRRREWVSCPTSIVEHFHPHWGNAEQDSTYKKAHRSSNRDRRLFMQRMGMSRPRRRSR